MNVKFSAITSIAGLGVGRNLLAIAILLIGIDLGDSVRGDERLDAPSDRRTLGDPIPPGAVLRFGTTQLRHKNGDIGSVSFSPDGKLLVSTGINDVVRFFDVETGDLVRTVESVGMVRAALISPDGRRLVIDASGQVHLYDLETDRRVLDPKVQKSGGHGIAFSPNGRVFASSGRGEPVQIWDSETGDAILDLHIGDDNYDAEGHGPVAFSPNGALLACTAFGQDQSGYNGEIVLFDLAKGAVKSRWRALHEGQLVSLEFLDDNTLISSGALNRQRPTVSRIQLWDLSKMLLEHEFQLEEGEALEGVARMVLSHDRKLMVTMHTDKIVIWDTVGRKAQQLLRMPKDSFRFRQHFIQSLAISSDNRFVAAAGKFEAILWDITTGQQIHAQENTHLAGVLSIAPSCDGRFIASSSIDGAVHLWGAPTGDHIRKLHQATAWARDVVFSPDGERIVVCGEVRDADTPGGYKGFFEVIRVVDGVSLTRQTLPGRGMRVAVSQDGERIAVSQVVCQPDENPLDSNRTDREIQSIQVWDADGDSPLAELQKLPGDVTQLRFSNDNDVLWLISSVGPFQWNVTESEYTGRPVSSAEVKELRGFWRNQFAFAERQKRWFKITDVIRHGTNQDKAYETLEAFDTEQGTSVWKTETRHQRMHDVALSPDGRLLAVDLPDWQSGTLTRIVVVLSENGKEVASFECPRRNVRSLVFSKDGSVLYSGMESGEILAWDVSAAIQTRSEKSP